jgi:hypothetical protein
MCELTLARSPLPHRDANLTPSPPPGFSESARCLLQLAGAEAPQWESLRMLGPTEGSLLFHPILNNISFTHGGEPGLASLGYSELLC